jgi:4-diphosphocytidyl-2-C-methyl-D-erythritol kinase
LSVRSKRPDGYHNLETCFYPVPWTDVLEIIPGDKFTFTTTGIAILGDAEENLCVKAYRILEKDFNLTPVKIHLHKIIPSGAGLGGGSSDGAHTLRLLDTIFSLRISQERLMDYAAKLGSDCAYFIQDSVMIGSGRGEILTGISLTLKGKFVVIVKPEIHVSTKDAFEGIVPQMPQSGIREILLRYPVAQWKDFLKNDFEEPVFRKHPVLKILKDKLYRLGATYASMTGSGSAIVGIFESVVDISDKFPGAVCWSGVMD